MLSPRSPRPHLFNDRLFNAHLFNDRLFNDHLFNARLFNDRARRGPTDLEFRTSQPHGPAASWRLHLDMRRSGQRPCNSASEYCRLGIRPRAECDKWRVRKRAVTGAAMAVTVAKRRT